MKKLFVVSYTYWSDCYSCAVKNAVSVLTACSEDEALGIAYKTAREKYSTNTLINVMMVPDKHVVYAYSQLEGESKDDDTVAGVAKG